jgi:hypothetical protein
VSDARDGIIINQEEVYRCNQFRMTTTDAAIREIKVLIETTFHTQAKKPTTVARSKDQGPCMEIADNYITIQDNEERMKVVDYSGLDQSSHAPQLMPGGTLSDYGETTPTKTLVEELIDERAAKPATKTDRNKVIPETPRTIDPTHGLWSKVAQGSTCNKSEFTEVGRKGKPIKQPTQSNEKTQVPGPQHTTEDHRRHIFKRDSKLTATTNKDWQLINAINLAQT